MSTPKRHHFVPRAFLERFGRDGRVLIRRRDNTPPFVASAINTAVECGLYSVRKPDGTKSDEIEKLLGEVDTQAIQAIRKIDEAKGLPNRLSKDRQTLAVFIALQMTRTPEQRERVLFPRRVAEYAAGRQITQPLVTEYLEKVHLGSKPSYTEAQAAFEFAEFVMRTSPELMTQEFAIDATLRAVPELTMRLLQRSWSLEIARKQRLITADAPVLVWRIPSSRDRYEGVGIDNADEIRFPLDNGKQIILHPGDAQEETVSIEPARVRACNGDLAASCHQFVVGHPDRPRVLEQLTLAPKRPVMRFNTGPLYEEGPDGALVHKGEVLHTWVPRR